MQGLEPQSSLRAKAAAKLSEVAETMVDASSLQVFERVKWKDISHGMMVDGAKMVAKMVAVGCSSAEGVDYFVTFAPTAFATSNRLVAAWKRDQGLRHLDVDQIFVQSELDTEICFHLPPGCKRQMGTLPPPPPYPSPMIVDREWSTGLWLLSRLDIMIRGQSWYGGAPHRHPRPPSFPTRLSPIQPTTVTSTMLHPSRISVTSASVLAAMSRSNPFVISLHPHVRVP